jgi:hypothetical protein
MQREGLKENNFLCYQVESEAYFNLGDRVIYKGKERVIAGSTAVMKNGTVTYEGTAGGNRGDGERSSCRKWCGGSSGTGGRNVG